MAKHFRSNYAENPTQFNPPYDNSVCIPLTKGYHTLIDAGDFDKVVGCGLWAVHKNYYSIGYARRSNTAGRSQVLHRIVSDTPADLYTDHINHNGLDNRRANLRVVNSSQNQANRAALRDGYKGVYKHSRYNAYWAQIRANGVSMHLGTFDNELDAAKAYDIATLKHNGEHALTNLPKDTYHGQY